MSVTSCVRFFEDVQTVSNQIKITFNGVESETKGKVVTTGNLSDNYTDYTLYAYAGNTVYINSADYQLNNGVFAPASGEYRWGAEALGFWLYPSAQDFITNIEQNATSVEFSYNHRPASGNNDASDSKDALFGYATAERNQPVGMTLYHALSSIKVIYEDPQIAHHITNITVSNVNTAGTCVFGTDNKFTWSNQTGGGVYSQDMNTYVTRAGVDLTDGEMTFFVVPGTGFTVTIYLDNRTTPIRKTFGTADLAPGKCAKVYISDDMDFDQDPKAPSTKIIERNPDGTYFILIEAYVTGKITKELKEEPVDFVLVLDVSGSMNYNMNGGTASKESDKRIYALKEAVRAFADTIANHQKYGEHRVCLIKFSGKTTQTVGNGIYTTYDERINYTQVVNQFTDNMNTVKDNVDALSAVGGTLINNGLSLALQEFQERSRDNAKRVCIVFTDGGPGSYGWSGSYGDYWPRNDYDTKPTAQNAVYNAWQVKKLGAEIYSVGVFGNISAFDQQRSNEFMSRISSNYPNATTFDYGKQVTTTVTTLRYKKSGSYVEITNSWPWGTYYSKKTLYKSAWKASNTRWWYRNSDFEGCYYKSGDNYYPVIVEKSGNGNTVKLQYQVGDEIFTIATMTNSQKYWTGTLYYETWDGTTKVWNSTDNFDEYYYKAGNNYYPVSIITEDVTSIVDDPSNRQFFDGDRTSEKYYKNSTSATDLISIFSDIAHETAQGGSFVPELTAESYAFDILSDIFDLPEEYGDPLETGHADDITFYSKAQTGYADGVITWASDSTKLNLNWTFNPTTKSLNAKGWDYSANCCGEGCTGTGHKLIIKIDRLKIHPDAPAGTHYTNQSGSGIYDARGNLVIQFDSPFIKI